MSTETLNISVRLTMDDRIPEVYGEELKRLALSGMWDTFKNRPDVRSMDVNVVRDSDISYEVFYGFKTGYGEGSLCQPFGCNRYKVTTRLEKEET